MGNITDGKRSALGGTSIHQQWAATYRTPEAQWFYELAFDEIARQLRAPIGATILDAGCGSCAKSALLARRGFNVVGTDFSQSALAMAAETLRAQGLEAKVTLREADLLQLPFADGEFPYVLCWGVLMHVPELQRAIAELIRVLAPGGMLVISEGNMHAAQSVAIRMLKRVLRRGRGRVVRTQAGLESREETSQGELLTRQTDIPWLIKEAESRGLQLKTRMAGQLTELYAVAPWGAAKRAIHMINNAWFRHVTFAGAAFGNILIFEKRP